MNEITPLTLHARKSSAIWLLLACCAFVAAGIWLGQSEGWPGYLCAAFFALGIPLSIVQLLPGSTFLHLDSGGFTFCIVFRKTFIPWSAVEEFFVVTTRQQGMKVHTMVGMNFVPSYDKSRLGRRISAIVANAEGALPDNYGMKSADLAALMNARLLRAKSDH